jgi:hypothetical protein
VLRFVAMLLFEAVFALPRVGYRLAMYFWSQVLVGTDPDLARARAARWTWITLLGIGAVVVLWMVLANLVHL